jgi:ankyrin repeat protein
MIVKEALKGGADPNSRDERGYTLLFNALLSRDRDILTALLEHGGDPNVQWPREQRPLFIAVRRGMPELVDVLIQYGADIDAVDERSKWTALSIACAFGGPRDIEALLRGGANPNWTPSSGHPGFSYIRRNPHCDLSCYKILLKFQLDPDLPQGVKGETLRAHAKHYGLRDVLSLIEP